MDENNADNSPVNKTYLQAPLMIPMPMTYLPQLTFFSSVATLSSVAALWLFPYQGWAISYRSFSDSQQSIGQAAGESLSPNSLLLAQQLPSGDTNQVSPGFSPSIDPLPPDPPQPIPVPQSPDPSPVLPPSAPSPNPPASPSPTPTGPTVPVESIQVLGSTIFDQEDFAAIVEPLQGRDVTLEELRQAADAITQSYLNEGYLNSRAILVNQEVVEGQVVIQVIEGRIGEIVVEGTERLRDRYIRRRIALGTKVPLRTDQLEDQLRLLRSDPLLDNIEASLRAGEGLGASTLLVRVTEADPLFGSFSVDNYSPPSVGSERTGVFLGHRNLTGLADRLSIAYDRTTRGGSDVVDFNYQVPVNPMEGSIQFRTVIERNEIVQEPFDLFDIEGESEQYEVTFRQPLVRSPREEFAVSLGFSYRDSETLAFAFDPAEPVGIGADSDGNIRTSVFRLARTMYGVILKGPGHCDRNLTSALAYSMPPSTIKLLTVSFLVGWGKLSGFSASATTIC